MAFQFTCPQGHLLEADVSAAGQQCTCPHCGMLFIIPPPPAPAMYAPPPMHHASAPQASFAPSAGSIGPPPAAPMLPPAPFANVGPTFSTMATPTVEAPSATAPAPVEVTKPAELLHIPCPNGHELDTPREMLNQEVLGPHCGEQFLLREKDSVEFKRKKQQEAEAKEYKRGKAWLNWAIVVAVLVVIGLVVLIFATSG